MAAKKKEDDDLIGAPDIDPDAGQALINQFTEFRLAPFSHAKGEAVEVPKFDEQFSKLHSDYQRVLELDRKVRSVRQDLADALYLGAFTEDQIPRMVGAGMRDVEFRDLIDQKHAELDRDIKVQEQAYRDIEAEVRNQRNDSFRFQSTSSELDSMIQKMIALESKVEQRISSAQPSIEAEIVQLREDTMHLAMVERELEGDRKEKKIRQKNCNALVPETNAYAVWMHKDSVLLQMEINNQLAYNRRYEGEGVDEFWGPLASPSENLQPVSSKAITFKAKPAGGVDLDFDVEVTSEDLIDMADQPVMICFGDPRALRPKYMPATGSSEAANKNAMAPLRVDPSTGMLSGNALFFEIPTIEAHDATKMELTRKMFIESFLNHEGENESVLHAIRALSEVDPETEMSPLLSVFSRHDKMQRSSEEKFKMSIDDTYMLERGSGPEGWVAPKHLETHEVWFGGKLPAPTSKRVRFVVYSVRKRSKKTEKQRILWMGILAVRRHDVQDLNRLAGTRNIGETEEHPSKVFSISLSAIVGKDMQRRIADAYVSLDVDRRDKLPYDMVRAALLGEHEDGFLGLNEEHFAEVAAQFAEEVGDNRRENHLRLATSADRNKMLEDEAEGKLDLRQVKPIEEMELSYVQFETLALNYINFEEEAGMSAEKTRQVQAKRAHILQVRGDEIGAMFERFDVDNSRSLELKELYVALSILGFSGVEPRLVIQLMEQYDTNGNRALEEPEFRELCVDALCLVENDKSSWQMLMETTMKPPAAMLLEDDRRVEHNLVGLFFGRSVDDGQHLLELDFGSLGAVTMMDGFRILSKPEEISTRDRFNDESFRMEVVRMLIIMAYCHPAAGGIVEDLSRRFEEIIDECGPDTITAKIDETRKLENHRRRLASGSEEETMRMFEANETHHLLEKIPSHGNVWEHAHMTLKSFDLIRVTLNEPLYPSFKPRTILDIYECRSEKTHKMRFMLVLVRQAEDCAFLTSTYPACIVPNAGSAAAAMSHKL